MTERPLPVGWRASVASLPNEPLPAADDAGDDVDDMRFGSGGGREAAAGGATRRGARRGGGQPGSAGTCDAVS